MNTTYKRAKVIKEYRTTLHKREVVVPVGATVDNKTACGLDDNYRFWIDWGRTILFTQSILSHDLTHYGINVPADHCEPWPQQKVDATAETNPLACDQR